MDVWTDRLPEPHQREYLSGYARFLGAGSGLAEVISCVILIHSRDVCEYLGPLLTADC